MLFEERGDFLIAAALPAQFANHIDVWFEPRARLAFWDVVEEFSNAFVHAKGLP
jgi:hypothetical protein